VLGQLRSPLTCCVIAAAALLLSGCSSTQTTTQEKSKPQMRKSNLAPLAEYEATLNPADYDQEVEAVQRQQIEEHPFQTVDIPRDTTAPQDQILQGFRIQIFSSASIDEANTLKATAIAKFAADSIYILFDAPVYKVRVGDFVARYDANQRLPEFVEKGYRDAWVVPDRIIRRAALQSAEKARDNRPDNR
jgi:hypothetical protein